MISDQKKKEQLELDIKELKQLVLQTQNQRVGQFLAGKLAQAKAQLQLLANTAKPIQVTPPPIQPKEQYISIHKFGWEDVEGTKKVKIMINLQSIKKQCLASQIHPQFTLNSVTIKIHQYKGKNYIFSIPKLYKEIYPQKCTFDLSTNYLNIKLQKKEYGQWMDINWKKDIFNEDKDQQRGRIGPMKEQEKLMDMMKKMYQEGDPQMQKVIKEAFEQSQDKKRAGGPFW